MIKPINLDEYPEPKYSGPFMALLAQKLNEVIEALNTGHYHEVASDGMSTEEDLPYTPGESSHK